MLFSSITFLYYFLPIALAVITAVPTRWKNSFLFLFSIVFYAWGEPKYVFLMLLSVAQGYGFGILIERTLDSKPRLSEALTAVSVLLSLAVLLIFKYTDFFMENLNRIPGVAIPLPGIALPIGISFYTFQLISYTVDVYRGGRAQHRFVNLAAYITMFPQLIAGPIVRYDDIADELQNRSQTVEKAAWGIRRFLIGLGKKILLANPLGALCETFRMTETPSVLWYWMYAAAYALQIYYDFSGYSDMAIGLGGMLGFTFRENFNYPYIAGSITEFWRRWHMSLGTWFRDYVYIPLGGNRVSRPRWYLNILIVWFLTGFWHGASWNFIAWGLYFAVLLVLEKTFLLDILEHTRILRHLYVLFAVTVSFLLFNGATLGQSFSDIAGLLGFGGFPGVSADALYYLRSYTVILLIGAVGATPIVRNTVHRLEQQGWKTFFGCLEPAAMAALLLGTTAYLVDGSFNPFLYFRF